MLLHQMIIWTILQSNLLENCMVLNYGHPIIILILELLFGCEIVYLKNSVIIILL
jgi:hypothetical protein